MLEVRRPGAIQGSRPILRDLSVGFDLGANIRADDFLSQLLDFGDTGLQKRSLFYRLRVKLFEGDLGEAHIIGCTRGFGGNRRFAAMRCGLR